MIFHSPIEPIYFLLPLLGFIIGLFGTMLGGGGGFFFLPILTLLLHVPTQTAVITSLVATLPIGLVGSVGHYRKQHINFKIGMLFALVGIIGAFIGAGITSRISSEQLKTSFGIYSILMALNIAYGTYKKKKAEGEGKTHNQSRKHKVLKGSFFGLFAGLITGTFGTSGTAPVLAGLFSLRIPIKMVIGTSLLIVLVNTFFAIGAHFLVGKIDLTLVYFLTAGSALGAISGPRLLSKTKIDRSENNARYWYALVMVALGGVMMVG
ncbi:sulfite exporter TauE/SafE family protein [Mangrovibacterium lignilyticum]|uniref:sulfite exporter TauE/SafE family protein n=1 Tax=Mangrovibacterium lignilyticum TaxID=2668052 RepID=UPI0013D185F3|nr:sulfite exporter TauE/SafE family protein [Mangrovibacterium lignilyticum]